MQPLVFHSSPLLVSKSFVLFFSQRRWGSSNNTSSSRNNNPPSSSGSGMPPASASATSSSGAAANSTGSSGSSSRVPQRPRGRVVRAVGRGRGSPSVIVGSRPLLVPASVVPEELINQVRQQEKVKLVACLALP